MAESHRPPHRRTTAWSCPRRRSTEMRARAARGGRRGRRGHHRRGARATTDAFSGPMGETIRNAVQLALGGFLSLASGRRAPRPAHARPRPRSRAPTSSAAGEARSGRTHRRAARGVPDRRPGLVARDVDDRGPQRAGRRGAGRLRRAGLRLHRRAVRGRASPATPTSSRPPAGCGSGCWSGSPATCSTAPPPRPCIAAAERAGWEPPTTLTAVLVPESQVRPVLGLRRPRHPPGRRPAGARRGRAAAGARRARPPPRPRCCGPSRDRGAVAGPARPWLEVRASYDRALRARDARASRLDTEAAAAPAGAARRPGGARRPARPGAGAAGRPAPGTAEKLAETLRSWLLHQGRRDDVAAELFVHPQTVRYRMGQLRELYGDRLDDPETVLALTVALGASRAGAQPARRRDDRRRSSAARRLVHWRTYRRRIGLSPPARNTSASVLRRAAGVAVLAGLLGGVRARRDAGRPAPPTPSSTPDQPRGRATLAAGRGPRGRYSPYVAMGDSYTAAPLVPDRHGDGCLRSSHNYPALVAAALPAELVDVSCSGADSTSLVGVQQTTAEPSPRSSTR